jgi:hypothetical protein
LKLLLNFFSFKSKIWNIKFCFYLLFDYDKKRVSDGQQNKQLNLASSPDPAIIIVEWKKNNNNFLIGNFTILTQLCDFFVVFWPFFFNTNKIFICVTVSFDLDYPINLVTTFSWPPTCDTRNYQLLVICHARSNVMSLNLSLKKKVKTQQKKSQSCVKIMKLPIKKLLVFFFSLDNMCKVPWKKDR